jgi:hypothetical protein
MCLGSAWPSRYDPRMIWARPLFGLLLSLVLAATSLTAAEMRGHASGSQWIEICSDTPDGSGITTLQLDAQGNPLDHLHNCPYCTLGAGMATLADAPVQSRPATKARRLGRSLATPHRAALPAQSPKARAPPSMI